MDEAAGVSRQGLHHYPPGYHNYHLGALPGLFSPPALTYPPTATDPLQAYSKVHTYDNGVPVTYQSALPGYLDPVPRTGTVVKLEAQAGAGHSNTHLHQPSPPGQSQQLHLSPPGQSQQLHPSPTGHSQQLHSSPPGQSHQLHPSPSGQPHQLHPSPSGQSHQLHPSSSGQSQQLHSSPSGHSQQLHPTAPQPQTQHPPAAASGKCKGRVSSPPGVDVKSGMKSTSSSTGTSPVVKSSSGDMHHLLSAVDTEMLAGSEKGDPTEQQLQVTLEDRELWLKFKEYTNEMIVTKNGRRMFPVFRCSVTGLDPGAMYTFLLDFVQVDTHRWKYVNGDWVAGGKAEPAVPNCVYIHPDSPNFGGHWMKEVVCFSKVKLTNKMNGGGQIMLNSLHKYEPRLHIIKVNQRNSNQNKEIHTFNFDETQFIAVTAYQNEEITALKIKYNPFAKAFLDAKERPDQRDLMDEGGVDAQGRALSHFPSGWYLPAGGHSLVPPPAHQFSPHLGLPNAGCDRLTLRNARPSPYTTYHQRRSPPHGSNFSRDMGNLSMFNLPDQWPNMAGMGTQLLTAGAGGSGGMGMGMGQSMGGQYPSMWMSSMSNVSQSCGMPYLRTAATGHGGYPLPPVSSPPSVSSPSGGLGGALPISAGGGGAGAGVQGPCEQPYDLGAYTSSTGNRDPARSVPWGALTPPPL